MLLEYTLKKSKETTMTSGVYNEESVEIGGKQIVLIDDGFMRHRELWNRDVAVFLAKRENIVLTEEHWKFIMFLRNFYEEFLISPNVKFLVKHLNEKGEKDFNTKKLYELFPRGPSFQGCKLAGLPKPTNCIDG
jgi:tRNA 2-thiouridine synthesizing protein E